jgi:hypothetical protein
MSKTGKTFYLGLFYAFPLAWYTHTKDWAVVVFLAATLAAAMADDIVNAIKRSRP